MIVNDQLNIQILSMNGAPYSLEHLLTNIIDVFAYLSHV